jgi:hypothetical protein
MVWKIRAYRRSDGDGDGGVAMQLPVAVGDLVLTADCSTCFCLDVPEPYVCGFACLAPCLCVHICTAGSGKRLNSLPKSRLSQPTCETFLCKRQSNSTSVIHLSL